MPRIPLRSSATSAVLIPRRLVPLASTSLAPFTSPALLAADPSVMSVTVSRPLRPVSSSAPMCSPASYVSRMWYLRADSRKLLCLARVFSSETTLVRPSCNLFDTPPVPSKSSEEDPKLLRRYLTRRSPSNDTAFEGLTSSSKSASDVDMVLRIGCAAAGAGPGSSTSMVTSLASTSSNFAILSRKFTGAFALRYFWNKYARQQPRSRATGIPADSDTTRIGNSYGGDEGGKAGGEGPKGGMGDSGLGGSGGGGEGAVKAATSALTSTRLWTTCPTAADNCTVLLLLIDVAAVEAVAASFTATDAATLTLAAVTVSLTCEASTPPTRVA